MPDPYSTIAELDVATQERLGQVLELRGSDDRQQEMMQAYLASLELPARASVLEVGCGTGVVCRHLAGLENVATVTGIDPSPVFIETARERGRDIPGLAFAPGDAGALPFDDAAFDLVVFHTTLCHLPSPDTALREAQRVLRPGGTLAVFDGDYVSATVALAPDDPLQAAVEAMTANFTRNLWLTRQLPKRIAALGLSLQEFRSHGYSAVSDPTYMLTIIQRGAELMVAAGALSAAQGEALQAEARRRADSGEFFGHISYMSAIARKT